jgi:hypothetical protein
MEVSSNLLKLKLDMVYRDLPLEEAEKRHADINTPPEAPAPAPEPIAVAPEPVAVAPAKPKRRVVKALVPKNK